MRRLGEGREPRSTGSHKAAGGTEGLEMSLEKIFTGPFVGLVILYFVTGGSLMAWLLGTPQ